MIESIALIVTALVAVYGAGLSTWTFYHNRARTRIRLNIEIAMGFLPVMGSGLGPTNLILEVSNPGHRAVTVQPPSILLPDGRQVVFMNPNSEVEFPFELREGKNCHSWTPLRDLAIQIGDAGLSGTVDLVASVKDLVGNEFKSKKWPLDVDDWSTRDPEG